MAKDDLKIIEQPVVDDELIIIPDLNKAYKARRPQPSTTSQPKVDLGLDLEIFPTEISNSKPCEYAKAPIGKPGDNQAITL